MNRPELFVKSVDILVDAYKKGNLLNGEPCNCAVGNLVAYRKGTYYYNADWYDLVGALRTLNINSKDNCGNICTH